MTEQEALRVAERAEGLYMRAVRYARDKSLTLGTFCYSEIIKTLKTCREEMNKMFKELQV